MEVQELIKRFHNPILDPKLQERELSPPDGRVKVETAMEQGALRDSLKIDVQTDIISSEVSRGGAEQLLSSRTIPNRRLAKLDRQRMVKLKRSYLI